MLWEAGYRSGACYRCRTSWRSVASTSFVIDAALSYGVIGRSPPILGEYSPFLALRNFICGVHCFISFILIVSRSVIHLRLYRSEKNKGHSPSPSYPSIYTWPEPMGDPSQSLLCFLPLFWSAWAITIKPSFPSIFRFLDGLLAIFAAVKRTFTPVATEHLKWPILKERFAAFLA